MFTLADLSESAQWLPGTTQAAWTVTLPDGRLGGATWEVGAGTLPAREEVLARLNALVEEDGPASVVDRLTSELGLRLHGPG